MKILLVEDNRDIADVIFDYFDRPDYILDYAATGTHAEKLTREESYDCIILDIMLPGVDGISLCQQLRKDFINTPVIMLTARDTNEDILQGLNCGADDYVVKPFELEVLEARINAVVRRFDKIGFQKELACGPLKIDVNARRVSRQSCDLRLNPTCYAILLLLAKNSPNPVSREDIERQIWDDDPPEEDVLRKHIYQLRTVVDKPFQQQIIKTFPKIGYAIEFAE